MCVRFAGGVGLLVRVALLPGAGERLPGPAGAEAGRDGQPPGRRGGAAGGAGCEYEEAKADASHLEECVVWGFFFHERKAGLLNKNNQRAQGTDTDQQY